MTAGMLLLAFLATSFYAAFAEKFGLDSYEVYLNDQLLIRQYVDKPLPVKHLALTAANRDDRLSIRYNECTAPDKIGKGRSISVRDGDGNVIKEWKFRDGGDGMMTIPVKELLSVQESSGNALVLYYAADGIREGQRLAAL